MSLFQNYEIPEEKAPNEAEDKDDEAKNNDLVIIWVKVFKFQIQFHIHWRMVSIGVDIHPEDAVENSVGSKGKISRVASGTPREVAATCGATLKIPI